MSPDASSPAPPPAGTPEVDAQHPWLGLASFTEETRGYFYGREDEVAELARRVQRKLLTILFGQSGLGKTSILRAGIVPRLRPEGYCPVYVRIDYSRESPPPAEQIKEAIFRATQATGAWTQAGVAARGESLWEFLHHRDDVLQDGAGRKLIPLLIFDQFEEIFTLAQSDEFGRRRSAQFIEDLADLVENRAPKALEERIERDEAAAEKFDFARADYRILIALREDYLAHLEGLKRQMPSITQNRMRLARMTGAQALEAVRKPGGRLVSEEVAESIVRFVAGGSELANAEVEPSLLSLICRELNNARIAQGHDEISAAVLAGSRETILTEFYERSLADAPPGVRQVIEDHLLTDSGYRESLAEERFVKLLAAVGAGPDVLATLVNRRLLRIEERLDVRRVELTHDVLCGVVKASRDLRLEREARDEAERRLAAQRDRERATRAALKRARKIAAACAVLAVVAVAGAVFGWFSMKRAQEAEARADQTRVMAEAARGESEKLVAYLLDDFQLELAPVGRLDVVAALAKRAIDYYNALPEALRTPQTERNRALALVRYGAALRTQARIEEGTTAINDAVGVLGRLRSEGDRSEATAIGLALGLMTQARLKSSVDEETLAPSARAVDILKGPASAADASAPIRRAYGEALVMHGFMLQRVGKNDEAIASLDAARATTRGIADLSLDDMAAAATFAEATSWQVQAYLNAGRNAEAQAIAQEAFAVTDRILAKRPGHMQALRAQALTASPLAVSLRDDMRLPEALAMSDRAIQAWTDFVRMDPGNAISWANRSVGHIIRSGVLEAMGRLGDSAANRRVALAFVREAPPGNGLLAGGASLHAGLLAVLEADRGRDREADAALIESERYRQLYRATLPDGLRKNMLARLDGFWTTRVALVRGEYARVLEAGPRFSNGLEALGTPEGSDRIDQLNWLSYVDTWTIQAAVAAGDRAAGERVAARILQRHASMREESMDERTERSEQRAWSAVALARAGRVDEARVPAAKALAFQRERAAIGREDFDQRYGQALALYASALVGGPEAAAQLAQARALLDRGPEEWRTSRSIVALRGLIGDAQARRR
jgi:tetratricopeptide (TPR) repeat protein